MAYQFMAPKPEHTIYVLLHYFGEEVAQIQKSPEFKKILEGAHTEDLEEDVRMAAYHLRCAAQNFREAIDYQGATLEQTSREED